MASAAAVAADAARSPLGLEVDEVNGITSEVTGRDEEPTGLEDEDDEDDDDIPSNTRRAHRTAARPTEEEEDDNDAVGGGDDLFGEEEEEEKKGDTAADKPRRHLDDLNLDSGDDEGREDRLLEEDVQEELETQERQVLDVELPRLPVPEPSDGELYLLKVPQFMSIDPKAWNTTEFQPPTADHHSQNPSANFSAYNTAMSTIRWRRSPNDSSQLQSNARINRWSDGSLTLQLASDPTVQYEMNGNSLAPPQRNPIKPTPTSISTGGDKAGRRGVDRAPTSKEKFDASKHAFTYLVMPIQGSGLIRVTHALTAGLTVSPPANYIDEAIVNLQSDLAAASGTRKVNGGSTIDLAQTTEDPELAKKRAEIAERDKMRARKRLESQQERERERTNRTLGRQGLSSQRYGGLSAGVLEDDDGLATTRGRGAAKAKPRRQRRANSEYSSEEDYGRRGFQASKEDDYDVEDDFVAASDEEEEVVEEDDDDDDGIIEEPESGRARGGTPKRDREADAGDEDAEGEVDDAPATGAERQRRRVVLADDEDEE